MIQNILLNTQRILTMFIKLMNKIQIKNEKYNSIWLYDPDILSNKKCNSIVTELYVRGRKLNISLIFGTKSYFAVPQNTRLNSTLYFFIKFPKKENFNKLHLIIHRILTFKTLWIFIKSLLQNHILFSLLILLFSQIILYIS